MSDHIVTTLLIAGNRMPDDDEIWGQVHAEFDRVLSDLGTNRLIIQGQSIHEANLLDASFAVQDLVLRAISLNYMHTEWLTSWFEHWLTVFTKSNGQIEWYRRDRNALDFLLQGVGSIVIVNGGRQVDWKQRAIERAWEIDIPVVWIKAGPPVEVVKLKQPTKEGSDSDDR